MKRYVGKRMRLWDKYRARLKKEFAAMGITFCEECGCTNGLGFAHSKKRKDIQTEADWLEVALLCHPDHGKIEVLPPPQMRERVLGYIAKREPVFA